MRPPIRPIRPLTRYVRAIVDTTIDILEMVRATLDERIEQERLAELRARASAIGPGPSSGPREYFGYQASYGVRGPDSHLRIVKPDISALVPETITGTVEVPCPSCNAICVTSPQGGVVLGSCHTCGASLGQKSGA